MKQSSDRIQAALRRLAKTILPFVLVLAAATVLALQFTETADRVEMLSLSSFVVLLAFSTAAFGWSRSTGSGGLKSRDHLEDINQAAVDFFLAALLALVSSFFAWMKTSPSMASGIAYYPLFAIHLFFLALALLIFLGAIFSILKILKT